MKRTRFPFQLWHWTRGNESLFELDRPTLVTFRVLVREIESGADRRP